VLGSEEEEEEGEAATDADVDVDEVNVDPDDDGFLEVRLRSPLRFEADVVDAATGAPLGTALADVICPGVSPSPVRADERGRVVVLVPQRGHSYDRGVLPAVTFTAPGYGRVATAPMPGQPLRVALRPGLTVEGRVRDSRGRALPASVTVYSKLPNPADGGRSSEFYEWRVTCDAEGRFSLAEVPPGAFLVESRGARAATVSVLAEHPGHESAFQRSVLVAPDRPASIGFALRPLASQEGRVVDEDGAPVPDASISCAGDSGEFRLVAATDAEGRFRLKDVPERLLLRVHELRFQLATFDAWLPVPELTLRLERAAAPIQVRLDHAYDVDVFAVVPDPAPTLAVPLLERGAVRALPPATKIFGHRPDQRFDSYRLEQLPRGTVFDIVLETWDRGHLGARTGPRKDVRIARGVRAGATLEHEGAPPAWVRVALAVPDGLSEDERVRAVLRNAEGEEIQWEELHPARVARGPSDLQLTTSHRGRLSLEVTAPGRAPAVRWFDVKGPGDHRAQPIELVRGGGALTLLIAWPVVPPPRLRLRVRDAASGVTREVEVAPPTFEVETAVDLGRFLPGDVTIQVFVDRRPLEELTARVDAGETTSVRLAVPED
jgi:hypothetical protein